MSTKVYVSIISALMITFGSFIFYMVGPDFLNKSSNSTAYKKSKDSKSLPELDWLTLNEFDYKTGKGPKKLKDLDGKMIRMPGYVVPLSDNYSKLDEFLLVPDGRSCVHVPPPPPNLIISVKLRKAIPMDKTFNPSWVIGIFKIEASESEFGGAAFKMDAIRVEEFKFKKRDPRP